MGAQLVGAAFSFALEHSLKPNETLLLLLMAHTARDKDPDPTYFGSRERSATALGRRVPDAGADGAERERRAAFQAVKVAVAGLLAAHAIEQVSRGHTGSRASFSLKPLKPFVRDHDGEQRGRKSLPLSVGNSYSKGYGIPTPKEAVQELGEERPPTRCPKHPNGDTGESCGICASIRRRPQAPGIITVDLSDGTPHNHTWDIHGYCVLCGAERQEVAA